MQDTHLQTIPGAIREILEKRNLVKGKDIQNFLYPRLDMLPHPSGMKGIGEAAKTIRDCIESGAEIVIWGDYDVDGTTGTSLLVNFFRELGVEAHWYIPNRLTEGYGLNSSVFRNKFSDIAEGEFLLITVDCGISDRAQVEAIGALGGTVIVTDHHQLPLGEIPDCIVLNPSQNDCGFHMEQLAGVGVAFYLAVSVRDLLVRSGFFSGRNVPNMKNYLGFVALGTIADLVELTFTNRILIRAGMESLAATSIPGLRAMLENAGINGPLITTEDVSFIIAPRINAAGRLGESETAVGLMTCDNLAAGNRHSKKLELFNNERKLLCEKGFESALASLDGQLGADCPAICVAGDFHAGVVGIVASRLVEKFNKPAIVFSRQISGTGKVTFKGSGRSIDGVSILQCLHESSESIQKYGGHAMAAGLTVDGALYDEFVKMFGNAVELSTLNNSHQPATGRENIFECALDDVMDRGFLHYLALVEPYGPKNEKPVFVDREASVVSCKAIGSQGQHLQITFRGKYTNYKGVGFGLGDKFEDVKKNRQRELFFSPMLNRFRGAVNWRVRVISL